MSRRHTFSLVYHDSGSQNVRILKHDKHRNNDPSNPRTRTRFAGKQGSF